jgi:hypothetical protein
MFAAQWLDLEVTRNAAGSSEVSVTGLSTPSAANASN